MQLRPHQEQAIQSMTDHDKGQVIVPTGGGKTICMIMDAVKQLEDYGTVVVVAPRILLAAVSYTHLTLPTKRIV